MHLIYEIYVDESFLKQSYNVYIVDYYDYISTSVCLICCKCCVYCNGPNLTAVVGRIRDRNLVVRLFKHRRKPGTEIVL